MFFQRLEADGCKGLDPSSNEHFAQYCVFNSILLLCRKQHSAVKATHHQTHSDRCCCASEFFVPSLEKGMSGEGQMVGMVPEAD